MFVWVKGGCWVWKRRLLSSVIVLKSPKVVVWLSKGHQIWCQANFPGAGVPLASTTEKTVLEFRRWGVLNKGLWITHVPIGQAHTVELGFQRLELALKIVLRTSSPHTCWRNAKIPQLISARLLTSFPEQSSKAGPPTTCFSCTIWRFTMARLSLSRRCHCWCAILSWRKPLCASV